MVKFNSKVANVNATSKLNGNRFRICFSMEEDDQVAIDMFKVDGIKDISYLNCLAVDINDLIKALSGIKFGCGQ